MDVRAHWDAVWGARAPDEVSWYQEDPVASLQLVRDASLEPSARIIDVGGGASTLTDRLLAAGHQNLSVLDVSAEAIRRARLRLGDQAEDVEWFVADARSFVPPHRWDLWHDRAAFHFLTETEDRRAYRKTLLRALAPHGQLILATFGMDGPKKCSGLDVVRYSKDSLSTELGDEFELVQTAEEIHTTPAGGAQAFLFCRFLRRPGGAGGS